MTGQSMGRALAATAADPIRTRIRLAALMFVIAFGILGGRLVMFGAATDDAGRAWAGATGSTTQSRPDILDRNGEILATDIKVASLYGEPRNILDPDEAAELIVGVLPDLDVRALRDRLATNAGFAWIRREITADQQQRIHNLGIPGIGFMTEIRRFYPGGPTAAHVLGAVNVDNHGIAGIEKYLDDTWLSDLHAAGFATSHQLEPVRLSLDLRVQHILRDELLSAMERYSAIAASGIIVDVDTGEVVAMVSLPDYDPGNPADALQPDRLNRMSAGAYELGSVFKSFTFAMALDSGAVSMSDRIDATSAIRVGRHTINDFHGKHRVLTVPEVFIYSSNIGSARMALQVGVERQQEYLRRLGLLSRPETELPEVARPIVPAK